MSQNLSKEVDDSGESVGLSISTDETLVKLSLAKGEEAKAACGELFFRYYRRIDKTIGAVLTSRSVECEPSAPFYNTVFFDVCSVAFSPQKLRHFDAGHGSFEAWFLGAVVPRATIDWLRHQKRAPALRKQPLGDDVATPLRVEPTRADEVNSAVAGLTPPLRSSVELLCCADRDVSKDSLVHVAQTSGRTLSQVRESVASLAEELREQEEGAGEPAVREKLALLQEREQSLSVQLRSRRRALYDLGAGSAEIAKLEARCARLTLGMIRERRRDLGKVRDVSRQALAGLDYQETFLSLDQVSARRERLLTKYRRGTWIVKPTCRQIADVLGVREGTVASQLSRARQELASILGSCREVTE